MKLAVVRAGIVLLSALLLQSCGGGGDGDGDNGGGNGGGDDPRLAVSQTNVSASATPGQANPLGSVSLTISNAPAGGLFLFANFSAMGVESIDFVQTSSAGGRIDIRFKSPNVLLNDTYADEIELHVCVDDQCNEEIHGSPTTIQTSYVVSGTGVASATIDRTHIEVAAPTNEQIYRLERAQITLSTAPAAPIHVELFHTANGLAGVNWVGFSESVTDIEVNFTATEQLGPGQFSDTVDLRLCYDPTCVREVDGSPMTISTVIDVNASGEPGVPALEVESLNLLTHDVVDAEYSKSLGLVVMVSSYPSSAIHVYDVTTGVERQQALSRLPSSVSVSPDGLTAAVGHDALVSIFDLVTVGQPGAPAPTLLNVSIDSYDVVLDGRGFVHVVSPHQTSTEIHSVEIATNTESLSSIQSLYGGAKARLHPSGDFIYTANNGVSPDDIEKWDITGGSAVWVADSPYHGDYGMCGDLWFREDGATIFTACGNTFRSSLVPGQDMVYTGAIPLAEGDTFRYQIRSISHSSADNEMALIEYNWYGCEISAWEPCYTHFAVHEGAFLNRLAVYSIAPVEVNGTYYDQIGLHVFHDAVGPRKYMISRLEGMPNPAAEYYLSVIE